MNLGYITGITSLWRPSVSNVVAKLNIFVAKSLNSLFFQVRLMERRLNEVEWSSGPSSGNNASGSSDLFSAPEEAGSELSLAEKDRIIRSLESEVEAQVIKQFALD